MAQTDGGDSGTDAGCVPAAPVLPSEVPVAIEVPAGVTLVEQFHAVGTQNYQCTATPVVGDAGKDTYSWVFVGPEANLSNSCHVKVATHFAGPLGPSGPEWKFTADGSVVQGAKDASAAVSGSIPELKLHATAHPVTGVFSEVTFIQRLHTSGGAAPAAGLCTVDHVDDPPSKVPYEADYYFYTGPNDGGTH